ncbi:MAG: hypothetical protein PVH88_13145 [Ignavibacteria bacterium]|jgi:hypothetical protein
MKKISRSEFIKISAMGLAATAIPTNIWSAKQTENDVDDKEFFNRLLKYNDIAVGQLMEPEEDGRRWGRFGRTSVDFSILTASYYQPDSKYYKSKPVLTKMDQIITGFLDAQYPNGTMGSGGNVQSPPDTSFLVEHLAPSYIVLNQYNFNEVKDVKDKLEKFLLNVGEALIVGGVHTPNHRWEVTSSLAYLYSIFKDERYLKRVDEWLAEGVFIDEDGQYCERSRNYSPVVNYSLLNIGRLLNRPSYFDIVKKNCNSNYYYLEANGELITVDSRRQDQNGRKDINEWYPFYRFLAIHNNDKFFADIARKIETFDGFDHDILCQTLIFVMTNPELGKKLPEGGDLPTNYAKLFPLTGLARVKRGDTSVSFFGGNDKPIIIASGRSYCPTFLTFRKGSAFLEYARLSSSFFSMGYFRSEGVVKDGNTYTLHEKKEAYYFHPMTADKRNKNGDYKLSWSSDHRFWSKMDFDSRPRTTLTLDTKIVFTEDNGSLKMDIDVNGPENVPVILEFCFRSDGKLEGVTSTQAEDDFILQEGAYAKYTSGEDSIVIGPGTATATNHMGGYYRLGSFDGEQYAGRTAKGRGMHVYLTGSVPFKHTMTIK